MTDFKVIEKILQSGSNILEVTDAVLNNDSIFEVYTDDASVIPVGVTVSGTTASITFDSKPTTATGVKIFINNLDGEYIPPTSGDTVEVTDTPQYGNLICKISVNGEVTEVRSGYISANNVNYDNGYGGISQFEFNNSVTDRIDNLDANDILYDENSTVYSAMGDIDSLTTTSKNLVGAINEVASSSGGDSNNYSTEETVIGKWLDNSNVYRKVSILNSTIQLNALGTWTDGVIDYVNGMEIIKADVIVYNEQKTNKCLIPLIAVTESGNQRVRVMSTRNAQQPCYSGSLFIVEYVRA